MPTKPVADLDTALDFVEATPEGIAAIVNANNPVPLNEYTCERCGYHYQKANDFAPLLCYRCMRFIAKKVCVVMNTIQPPTSRPVVGDI